MPIISDNYPMKGLFQCPHIYAVIFFIVLDLRLTKVGLGGAHFLYPYVPNALSSRYKSLKNHST